MNDAADTKHRKPAMAEVGVVVAFIVGIVGWLLLLGPLTLILGEWAEDPKAGDAAIGLEQFNYYREDCR